MKIHQHIGVAIVVKTLITREVNAPLELSLVTTLAMEFQ